MDRRFHLLLRKIRTVFSHFHWCRVRKFDSSLYTLSTLPQIAGVIGAPRWSWGRAPRRSCRV